MFSTKIVKGITLFDKQFKHILAHRVPDQSLCKIYILM